MQGTENSFIVFNLFLLRLCQSQSINQFKPITVLQRLSFTGDIVKSKKVSSTLECVSFCLVADNLLLPSSKCADTCYCYLSPSGIDANSNCASFEYKLGNPFLNCHDIYQIYSRGNGIYNITVNGLPLQVYCDMDGGAWTVIQRRLDGSEDFLRSYSSYQSGFGDVTGEHWLGLNNIHDIISSGSYEVRFDLEDFEGNTTYAEYDTFIVSDNSQNYTLTISGYSGNAGDGMKRHNGMKFSAVDVDYDTYYLSCAELFKGAWWYAACHHVNINGMYYNSQYGQGINWYQWHGYYYSLKSTSMKIRPRK